MLRARVALLRPLFRGADRGPMSTEDHAIAQEIAARAGLALDNMRLYREQRRLAAELQKAMLTAPVEPDHLQIAVRYVPAAQAAQVGGDWYDAFLQPSGETVLVIGDVMGHDTSAAATMGQLRSMLRGIAVTTGEAPARLLSQLDAAMLALRTEAMATAVVARVQQDEAEAAAGTCTVRWSNAGHPPPMVVRPDGSVEPLATGRTEVLLGVDPGARRTESGVTLAPGATLLFYTDGLVERRDRPVKDGMDVLRATLGPLGHLDLEALCDQVLATMIPGDPEDDVAVVAVRLRPQDRPRPPGAGPSSAPSARLRPGGARPVVGGGARGLGISGRPSV